MYSNAYGPCETLGGVKENWCYERGGWLSRAVCVEVVNTYRAGVGNLFESVCQNQPSL